MPYRIEHIRTQWLIVRHLQGEPKAFEQIVALWERRLFYYLRRLLRAEEDAWDVLQEVWLQVFRRLPELRDSAAFPAWLYRIGHHQAVSLLRKQRKLEVAMDGDGCLEVQDSAELNFTASDAEEVHAALARLPQAQREVLTLFFLEGFSISDIAEIVEAPEGTVKSRMHYGKQALRKEMESHD